MLDDDDGLLDVLLRLEPKIALSPQAPSRLPLWLCDEVCSTPPLWLNTGKKKQDETGETGEDLNCVIFI